MRSACCPLVLASAYGWYRSRERVSIGLSPHRLCASTPKSVARRVARSDTPKDVHAPMKCPALPCPALPCPALPCPALPCPALPCPALCCPALPCPALSCPALPCPTLIGSIFCPALVILFCPALVVSSLICPALTCCTLFFILACSLLFRVLVCFLFYVQSWPLLFCLVSFHFLFCSSLSSPVFCVTHGRFKEIRGSGGEQKRELSLLLLLLQLRSRFMSVLLCVSQYWLSTKCRFRK